MLNMKIFVLVLTGVSVTLSAPPPSETCTSTNVGEFQADDADCTKFHQCSVSGWVEFTCGPGTEFNPAVNVCDWPYNVNCQLAPEDDKCVHGDKEVVEDSQCSLFKYCIQGKWSDYRCPFGYRFDPTNKDCFPPEQYPCPTIPCDSSPCKNGGTCTNSGTTFTCECPSTHEGAMCETMSPDDPTGPSGPCTGNEPYQENSMDCKGFYACVNNEWVAYNCPTEVPAFNAITGACDYLYNVDCGTRATVCVNDARLAGNDEECMQFYRCISNEWVLYNCPASLRFNNTVKDCTPDAYCPTATQASPCASGPCSGGSTCVDVSETEYRCQCPPYTVGDQCQSECTYPCPSSALVIFPDLTNSASAVICEKGQLSALPCPSGEVFKPTINRCEPAA